MTENKRPSVESCLMRTAKIWGERGTCPRANVGAVLSKQGRIISVGYIGSPPNKDHCYDVGCLIYDKNEGCVRGIHAEINCLGYANRRGISTEGADIFITYCPCLRCAQAIVAAGIIKVVYLNDHRDMRGVEYLKENEIEIMKFKEK